MVDPKDREPQGDPETVVLLPCGQGSLVGLRIKDWPGDVILGIREDEVGRPVSCAVTSAFGVDTSAWQSNPRRVAESGETE